MVRAEKAYGSIAPIKSPENSSGWRMLTWVTPTLVVKAPKRARATRQADPIANPFPIAAVVFPAASSLSVASLTLLWSSDISAIPPALSEMGPYPSIARAIGRHPNIPRAERAIPYIPAKVNEM